MAIPGESSHHADSKFTEMDETIKYTYTLEPVTFSVGNIWYTYPDNTPGIPTTAEVFGSVSVSAPLNPTLSFYHDYREYDAQYYELGFSQTFSNICTGSEATITPFAAFGFGSNSEGVYTRDGLEQVTIGTSLSVPVGPVALVPTFNYSFKVDDSTVNQFWFGTAVNYTFE